MFKIIVLIQSSPTPHILKIKVEPIIKSQLFTTCCADTMGPNLKILSFSQRMSIKICKGIVGPPVTGAQDLEIPPLKSSDAAIALTS